MSATTKEKLLESAKEKKLLRPSDLAEFAGARGLLSRLVENGELIKVGRGLYALPDNEFNEQQSLLEAARLVPKGVICLLPSLRFHDLTTQNPFWQLNETTVIRSRIHSFRTLRESSAV